MQNAYKFADLLQNPLTIHHHGVHFFSKQMMSNTKSLVQTFANTFANIIRLPSGKTTKGKHCDT